MINKYQQGGATGGGILDQLAQLPQDLQKKIMTAFAQWAQQKGLDVALLQNDKNALEQAMGAFLQEIQGAKPKARLGAKLNYIRSLKGECPEGQEVKYFQKGGIACKKCVAKAQEGTKTDGKKVIDNFKNSKYQGGGNMMKLVEANKERKKKEAEKKAREDKWKKGQIVVGKDIARGGKNEGPKSKVQDNAVPKEDVPSHDKKKKYQIGGKLKNSFVFDRRSMNLQNGYGVTSDWIYQNYKNGKHTGDFPPTLAGRTIYTSPQGNDTIFWRDPDKWQWNDRGMMPMPVKSANQQSAKANFYRQVRKTSPTTYNKESNQARVRALKGY